MRLRGIVSIVVQIIVIAGVGGGALYLSIFSPSRDSIVYRLESPDPKVRRQAISELDSSFSMQMLNDEDLDVRLAAVTGLGSGWSYPAGRISPERKALLDSLGDSNKTIRLVAGLTLLIRPEFREKEYYRKMLEESVSDSKKFFENSEITAGRDYPEISGKFGDLYSFVTGNGYYYKRGDLLDICSSTPAILINEALLHRLLDIYSSLIHDIEAVPLIIEATHLVDPRIRFLAAKALGFQGDSSAEERLKEMESSALDIFVSGMASAALVRLGQFDHFDKLASRNTDGFHRESLCLFFHAAGFSNHPKAESFLLNQIPEHVPSSPWSHEVSLYTCALYGMLALQTMSDSTLGEIRQRLCGEDYCRIRNHDIEKAFNKVEAKFRQSYR